MNNEPIEFLPVKRFWETPADRDRRARWFAWGMIAGAAAAIAGAVLVIWLGATIESSGWLTISAENAGSPLCGEAQFLRGLGLPQWTGSAGASTQTPRVAHRPLLTVAADRRLVHIPCAPLIPARIFPLPSDARRSV